MADELTQDLASLRINRTAPATGRPWLRWLLIIVAISLVGLGTATWGRAYVEARFFKVEVVTTEVLSISPAQASAEVTSTGYVIPQVVAKVGSKVVGRIVRVGVHEGGLVKAGDLLFELDATDQRSAILSANAKAAAARARALSARASLAEAEVQYQREKRLLERGAASKAVVEELEAKIHLQEAQAKASEAEATAQQADVQVLQTSLRNLKIFAPISGTAMTKPAQPGDVVYPEHVLVELADFSTLMVEADVSEGKLQRIRMGGPAQIVLDAAPDARLRGEVTEISPKLNRAKATATVKVKFIDIPVLLRPEMGARVSFLAEAMDEAKLKAPPKVVVPAVALLKKDGASFVFLIEDGKVRQTAVTLGEAFGTGYVMLSGPPPGSKLVKEPAQVAGGKLQDGQSIKERSE